MEGSWARLVLVFHCIDAVGRDKHPNSFEVTEYTVIRVVNIMRLLMRHAFTFYSAVDPDGDKARELANLILAKGWLRFTTKRDLAQNWKPFRNFMPWEIERVLDRLEGFGWIIPEEGKLNEHRRPVAYTVNNKVHTMFSKQATKERERRAEVHEFLKKVKQ